MPVGGEAGAPGKKLPLLVITKGIWRGLNAIRSQPARFSRPSASTVAAVNHFRARGPNKPKLPAVYAFSCEIKVAPFTKTSGHSAEGGQRWTWPGPSAGPFTTECDYRCYTEAQMLAHLIVTHRMKAVNARRLILDPA